ncbi:MAG: hypothetical protein FWE25_03320 [Lachnospiraceae bacterium]|nr:hypothetical protein [Lachnospiraceae bacterium]
MKKYSLYDVFTEPITFDVWVTANGRGRLVKLEEPLEPGKVYETDDERLIGSLESKEIKRIYTNELEQLLKKSGVPYHLGNPKNPTQPKKCSSCSGRRIHIFYKVVRVYE